MKHWFTVCFETAPVGRADRANLFQPEPATADEWENVGRMLTLYLGHLMMIHTEPIVRLALIQDASTVARTLAPDADIITLTETTGYLTPDDRVSQSSADSRIHVILAESGVGGHAVSMEMHGGVTDQQSLFSWLMLARHATSKYSAQQLTHIRSALRSTIEGLKSAEFAFDELEWVKIPNEAWIRQVAWKREIDMLVRELSFVRDEWRTANTEVIAGQSRHEPTWQLPLTAFQMLYAIPAIHEVASIPQVDHFPFGDALGNAIGGRQRHVVSSIMRGYAGMLGEPSDLCLAISADLSKCQLQMASNVDSSEAVEALRLASVAASRRSFAPSRHH